MIVILQTMKNCNSNNTNTHINLLCNLVLSSSVVISYKQLQSHHKHNKIVFMYVCSVVRGGGGGSWSTIGRPVGPSLGSTFTINYNSSHQPRLYPVHHSITLQNRSLKEYLFLVLLCSFSIEAYFHHRPTWESKQ